MDKKFCFLLASLLLCLPAFAGRYVPPATPTDTPHIRISLVTCGPGFEEIYQVFGHTAVRVIDSVKHTDLAYNYGTFNGFEENFELKFMRGKLDYYLSVYAFNDFIQEYIEQKRSVGEQVLLIDNQQKMAIVNYLNWNAEPANRAYKYDFFFDNCATRIRDIFPEALGRGFTYGKILPVTSRVTFRDIINRYFYYTLWERFGINILLGSRIDKIMDDRDIMFLPDYLDTSISKSTLSGNKLTTPEATLLGGTPTPPAPINGPLILTWSIAILTIAGLSIKRLRLLGRVMSMSLLFITGLLGCLILVMWFGTNHQGCGNNYNILWALPVNIYIAFAQPKGKGRYALVAIGLIFVTLLLHIFGIQQLILQEFLPLLLALVYIYGTIYKQDTK